MSRFICEFNFQQILGRHLFKKYICVPNVYMYEYRKGEYEADFLYFNLKTLHLTEVEIKLSVRDFLNDFKKKRYHDSKEVMYLYYCMPSEMYYDNQELIDSKLGDAGLILINGIDTDTEDGAFYEFDCYKKRAKKRKGVSKLSIDRAMYYMRIGCMKWIIK